MARLTTPPAIVILGVGAQDTARRVQSLYDQLLSTMQTLGVDKDINQESVAVMEHASPGVETRGNPARMLILGGVLGLIAGVGLLLLVDRRVIGLGKRKCQRQKLESLVWGWGRRFLNSREA